MKPEQQRIAIAEACGWTQIEPCTCCDGVSRGYQPTPGAHKKHIPDYLNDLNAMHEAEATLRFGRRKHYIDLLGETYHDIWGFCTATAAQRAEAFLRTIGKWEDDK
jgi:hypothetical protein